MHYGLIFTISDLYAFDKHWHYASDMLTCPGKLFHQPPAYEDLPEYMTPGELKAAKEAIDTVRLNLITVLLPNQDRDKIDVQYSSSCLNCIDIYISLACKNLRLCFDASD